MGDKTRMIDRITSAVLSAIFATFFVASTASANLITNGDFETGDFSGWTVFATAGGTTGVSDVVSFDTTGSGASLAAHFQVGRVPTSIGPAEGGGILQNITLATAGLVTIGLDIASDNNGPNNNAAGGIFTLLFNNIVLDSFDFDFISSGVTQRTALNGVVAAAAGVHEIRIEMTRGFGRSDTTPEQYIDNVVATSATSQIPEPSTLAILGFGLAGLALMRRRKAA